MFIRVGYSKTYRVGHWGKVRIKSFGDRSWIAIHDIINENTVNIIRLRFIIYHRINFRPDFFRVM